MDILTPQKLWEGYDRTTDPAPNVITVKDGDTRLYFAGPTQGGCTVRVYARLVMPKSANGGSNGGSATAENNAASDAVDCNNCEQSAANEAGELNPKNSAQSKEKPPVIILVSPAKTDIDSENTDFFTTRGYAVLLVDYYGKCEGKTHFTVYPKTIDAFWEHDPCAMFAPPKDLKKSCWYFWAACLLHSVTYLESCGLVDKDKIGICGMDEGATLVFKTSFCKAIKAGVTFFGGDLTGMSFLEGLSGGGTGSGGGFGCSLSGTGASAPLTACSIYDSFYETKGNGSSIGGSGAALNGQGKSGMLGDGGQSEELLAYKAGLDSRAYVKNICYPVLINASTNEKRGTFDYLADLYNSTTNGCFCVFPSADRAISLAQRSGTILWFNSIFGGGWNVPPKPMLSVFGSDGAVYAEVSGEAQSVTLYYAEENPAPFRNWKEVVPTKAGENKYLARLEIFKPEKAIYVFANISYEGGFTFSTPVLMRVPTALGVTKTEAVASRLLYRRESGTRGFIVRGDSMRDADEIKIEKGPQGLEGVCGDRLITYKTGDSRYAAQPGSVLQLIVSAKTAQDIEISVLDSVSGGVYRCYKRVSDKEWTILTLNGEDFKSAKGNPKFDKVAGIKLRGQGIILNSMLWV